MKKPRFLPQFKPIKMLLGMLVFFILILSFMVACSDDDPVEDPIIEPTTELPTVTTASISAITQTTATAGGDVTDDGGDPVTNRGVYWGTSESPETTGTKLQIGSGEGAFTGNLTALGPGTTFYVKAYATNKEGTAFGAQVSFETLMEDTCAVTTDNVTAITSTTATVSGALTCEGEATATERGVYWGTSKDPETTGTKLQIGGDEDAFTGDLTALEPGTTYYVKAYVVHTTETAFGDEVSFTTLMEDTCTVTTDAVTAITSTTATVGGTITCEGEATATERGVYWGTSENPETTGTKLQIGGDEDTFTGDLTALEPGTTYYVKAYATTTEETVFGAQVSFETNNLNLEIISGDDQSIVAYNDNVGLSLTLTAPLKIKATNSDGEALINANVRFEVIKGAGMVSTEIVQTDANGFAETNWTLGDGDEDQIVQVKIQKENGEYHENPSIEFNAYYYDLSGEWQIKATYIDCDIDTDPFNFTINSDNTVSFINLPLTITHNYFNFNKDDKTMTFEMNFTANWSYECNGVDVDTVENTEITFTGNYIGYGGDGYKTFEGVFTAIISELPANPCDDTGTCTGTFKISDEF